MDQALLSTLFILIGALAAGSFVIGLHFMNSPATARNGNLISAGGMSVAVVATFLYLLLRDCHDEACAVGGLTTAALIIIIVGFAHRRGGGHVPGPARGYDSDAAAGLALQRGRRRCRGHRRDLRLPAHRGHGRGVHLHHDLRHPRRAHRLASPSPVRSSPRANCRVSSPASPSRCPAASTPPSALGVVALVTTILLVLGAGESPVLELGSEIKTVLLLVLLRAPR